jgi:HEAT repeat protein
LSETGYQGPVFSDIENVRYYAAETLLRIGSPARSAVPALTEALRDEHPRVREIAARALKEIQGR